MPQQFSNNARSTITSSINNSATSLTVQSAAADLFPAADVGTADLPSANNWFKATLQDVNGNVEIIYVRTRTVGSAVFGNILRGREGTTARAFTAGSAIGLRVTAADIQASINITGNDNVFTGENEFLEPIVADVTGDVTGNVTGDLTGNVTGNVTGDLTGNVTGDVTGNVTGDVTGNAGTVTNGVYTTGNQSIAGNKTLTGTTGIGANWTVAQSGTDLVFFYNGNRRLSLSSTGALVAANNVTAYGAV